MGGVTDNDTAGATVGRRRRYGADGDGGLDRHGYTLVAVVLATQPTAAVTVAVGGTTGDVTVDRSSLTLQRHLELGARRRPSRP